MIFVLFYVRNNRTKLIKSYKEQENVWVGSMVALILKGHDT